MMGALLGLVVSLLQIIHVAMAAPGSWEVLVKDAGVSSMHTAVLHTGTVIFLDRTDIGPSHMKLANGFCRNSTTELVSNIDCYAHSAEFTPGPNTVRPLTIQTDTWCSSGAFIADGTLVHTGGDFDGANKIRYFKPCAPGGNCDWAEDAKVALQARRWYASNQVLPDGSIMVVGGQVEFSYEFLPSRGGLVKLPFLQETHKLFGDDQNLYPFLHLLPSGNVFIFARRDSIVLDPNSGNIVRKFSSIPGEPRNYPTQGSSVMLPLDSGDGFTKVTIMVCGGGNDNAYSDPDNQWGASATCGLLEATAEGDPQWKMLDMPFPRVMGDMLLLPNGRVLLINGAQNGAAGWELASNPVLNPVIYTPSDRSFEVQTPSTIARMYHSTAVLLPSTKILVAGSNTHEFYTFTEPFPTELRVEAFSPHYLDATFDSQRPTIKSAPTQIGYGAAFKVTVSVTAPTGAFQLRLGNPPFATHSFSQGQRQLALAIGVVTSCGINEYSIASTAPPNAAVAPAGYYMLFPVQNDVPGSASWVQLVRNTP